ncbi:hypothetical protein C1H46_038131 [Malus baccata]|uniref:Uncharacterized protein n=1 Tax=Malus baccata TaxID=106549 RepID=A0A540KQ27_MALBA|nr:hypothetical protein C1H46_038131 [Malus baccata]
MIHSKLCEFSRCNLRISRWIIRSRHIDRKAFLELKQGRALSEMQKCLHKRKTVRSIE